MGAEEAIKGAQADLAALPNRDVEALRRIRKKVSKRMAPLSAGVVKEVGFAVCRSGPRWVAYELVAGHEAALASLTAEEVEAFGAGMADWSEVDAFGMLLGGPAWRAGAISDRDVMRWARSDEVSWRRAALAATVALNDKMHDAAVDADRTLKVCGQLANDNEEAVMKALSRALRSLADLEPGAVSAFVVEHDEVLAARVKREVRNKLSTCVKGTKSGKAGANRRVGRKRRAS